VDLLIGDASKARRVLQWAPAVDFNGLIAMMVDADMERLTTAAAHARAVPAVR
jgi:GDPmannose 4,6-dehydratase